MSVRGDVCVSERIACVRACVCVSVYVRVCLAMLVKTWVCLCAACVNGREMALVAEPQVACCCNISHELNNTHREGPPYTAVDLPPVVSNQSDNGVVRHSRYLECI